MRDEFNISRFFPVLILELEKKGLVTRTFRRLDPDRQTAIMEAIFAESGEKGPSELNIKKVAERAGISVGSLYQYFGNRDNLLVFARELAVYLTAMTFQAYAPDLAALPLEQSIPAYLAGGIELGNTETGLMGFFAAAAYHGSPSDRESIVEPIAQSLLEVIKAMLKAAADRGEIRTDLDLDLTARLVNTFLIAVGDASLLPNLNAYYQLYSPQNSSEKVLETLVDLLFHGLSPRSNPS